MTGGSHHRQWICRPFGPRTRNFKTYASGYRRRKLKNTNALGQNQSPIKRLCRKVGVSFQLAICYRAHAVSLRPAQRTGFSRLAAFEGRECVFNHRIRSGCSGAEPPQLQPNTCDAMYSIRQPTRTSKLRIDARAYAQALAKPPLAISCSRLSIRPARRN
jgi:hypothetical protein